MKYYKVPDIEMSLFYKKDFFFIYKVDHAKDVVWCYDQIDSCWKTTVLRADSFNTDKDTPAKDIFIEIL